MSCLSIVKRRHGSTLVSVCKMHTFLVSGAETSSLCLLAPFHILSSREKVCNLRYTSSYVLPVSSLYVSVLLYDSLHRGCLECACNRFQCIFCNKRGGCSSDSNTKVSGWEYMQRCRQQRQPGIGNGNVC